MLNELDKLIAEAVLIQSDFALRSRNIGDCGIDYEAYVTERSGRTTIASGPTPTVAVSNLLTLLHERYHDTPIEERVIRCPFCGGQKTIMENVPTDHGTTPNTKTQ